MSIVNVLRLYEIHDIAMVDQLKLFLPSSVRHQEHANAPYAASVSERHLPSARCFLIRNFFFPVLYFSYRYKSYPPSPLSQSTSSTFRTHLDLFDFIYCYIDRRKYVCHVCYVCYNVEEWT